MPRLLAAEDSTRTGNPRWPLLPIAAFSPSWRRFPASPGRFARESSSLFPSIRSCRRGEDPRDLSAAPCARGPEFPNPPDPVRARAVSSRDSSAGSPTRTRHPATTSVASGPRGLTPSDTSNAWDARKNRPRDPEMARHARRTQPRGPEPPGYPHTALPRGNFDASLGFAGLSGRFPDSKSPAHGGLPRPGLGDGVLALATGGARAGGPAVRRRPSPPSWTRRG